MASKCWFVLRQTHYPPPEFEPLGFGGIRGPICPGHLIPDLRHIDNVINREAPVDIPPSMPLYSTEGLDMKWNLGQKDGAGISSKFAAPITSAAGLTIITEAKLAFQQSVKNYWAFDSLKCHIFQPTRSYIDDTMESDEVASYLKRKGLLKSSSIFMITGVIVARGAKNVTAIETHQKSLNGSLGLELPTIISSTLAGDRTRSGHVESSAQKFTDFVWAVRLAKISRGMIDRQWSHETFASGATFSAGETTTHEIVTVLRDNGLDMHFGGDALRVHHVFSSRNNEYVVGVIEQH